MTDWTKEDTESLAELCLCSRATPPDRETCETFSRAAAHIEALESRIATLEGGNRDRAEEMYMCRVRSALGMGDGEECCPGFARLMARIATLEAEQSAVLANHLRRMVDLATERNEAEGVIREWAAAERGKYSAGGLSVSDEAYERWTKATEALLALATRLDRKEEL